MRFSCCACVALLLCGESVSAQFASPDQRLRPATVEDLFHWKELAELQLSPAGDFAACVLHATPEKKNQKTGDLYVVATAAVEQGEPALVRVTRHAAHDAQPRWSPDGKRLAFLSARDGEDDCDQVYVFDLGGGEPEQVSKHDTPIAACDWSPDGSQIYFLAPDPKDVETRSRQETQPHDDAEEYERKFQFQHVWALDLKTRESRQITQGEYNVTEFDVSPDGKQLALIAAPTPLLNYEHKAEIYTIPVVGGRRHRLTDNDSPEMQARWSPNGKWIAYAANAKQDGTLQYVSLARLFAVPVAGGKSFPLLTESRVGITGLGADFAWDASGRSLFALLDDGFNHRLVRVPLTESDQQLSGGEPSDLYAGPHLLTMPSFDKATKSVAFALEGPELPRDAHFAGLKNLAKPRRLTRFNPALEQLQLARAEVVHWKSNDGHEVEGLLYFPLDHKPGAKFPLLVNIHGGPLYADKAAWMMDMYDYPHLAAARGYGTLLVNYRGSTGYSDEFASAIVKNYYTKDVEDILSGVDQLAAKGLVDDEKLGIHGWSNGGILTAWITTSTDRFRAAAVGAGDVNWISDFGNADIGVPFDIAYFGGRPWDNVQHYLEKSPLFRMDKVKTPTLILHGQEDGTVPLGQAKEHFRALKEHARAPVELLIFPREEHSIAELAHQRTKVDKELAWFDKYVLGKGDDSAAEPLAEPLHERLAQHEGLYGDLIAGNLAPETVLLPAEAPPSEPQGKSKKSTDEVKPMAAFRLSRFEVTNAQYQCYLADQPKAPVPDHGEKGIASAWDEGARRFKPGYGNHPVVGVSPRDAAAYCRWLSKKCGGVYRLPTADEWTYAADSGIPAEFPWGDEYESGQCNSLSHWAEHTVFDADSFLTGKEGKKLLKDRLLTMQAGSFDPSDWHVYDLSGNVGEICQEAEGFVALGGSWKSTPADLRVDAARELRPKQRASDVGFRVVRE